MLSTETAPQGQISDDKMVSIRAFVTPSGIEMHASREIYVTAGSPAADYFVRYRVDLAREESLACVEEARAELGAAEARLVGDVLAARATGASWATIADALGITKQSAMTRYARWEDRK